jgi:surface antigen
MIRKNFQRFLLALLAALTLVLGVGVAPASATTSMTVRGTVICANGHDVVGVWVESSAGGSKFATWHAFGGHKNTAYYSTKIASRLSSTKITIRVGCGGSKASWWSDNGSPKITVAGNRTLNTRCEESAGKASRCAWPWKGETTTVNLGAPGNCTWGALQKWKAAVGTYPLTGGDAANWDNFARTHGWYVSGVPHVRAFVVFEPYKGGSFAAGHVGWVTGITYVGSGKFDITVVEMNAGANGFNKYRTHTYRHVDDDMSYIVAPVSKAT